MPPAFLSDEALLKGCLGSDTRAWDEFIARFSKLIYWAIRQSLNKTRFSSREDLVSDIFQDVFRKIFENNKLLDLKDAGHLKKFLVVLSTHMALDRIKSLSRFEEKSVFVDAGLAAKQEDEGLAGVVAASPDQNPDALAHENEKRRILAEAMEALVPKERACLEFSVHDNKTHYEISLLLGVSQDMVSSFIRRAKDKIRDRLKNIDF